jgi:hypothetical protein
VQLREEVHKLGRLLARPEILRNIALITITRSKSVPRAVSPPGQLALTHAGAAPRRSEYLPPDSWPGITLAQRWPGIEALVLSMLRGVMLRRNVQLRVVYDTSACPAPQRPRAR